MFVKGVRDLVRVTYRDAIYFNLLYYLVVLTMRHEIINSFRSSSGVSSELSKTTVVIGCLCGFHFIVDSIS